MLEKKKEMMTVSPKFKLVNHRPKVVPNSKTECDAQLTELRLKNITKSGWVQIHFEPLSFVS